MKTKLSLAPLIYVVLLMTPVYWLVMMSFKTNAEIGGALTFFPHDFTLSNYAIIFGDPDWYWGYINAILYVLMNVAISVSVALPAAYAFSRHDFFGHRQLFFALLMFRMMAPAILLAPFVEIFSALASSTRISRGDRALLLQRAARHLDSRGLHLGHPARAGRERPH